MSHLEEKGYVTKDFQIQEASRFAMVTFKRLMYYTCDKPDKFLAEVTEALAAFENQSSAQIPKVETEANELFDIGEPDMALDALTRYSSQRARDAMALGDALLGSIEARYRLLYGFRTPTAGPMSGAHGRQHIVSCAEPMD